MKIAVCLSGEPRRHIRTSLVSIYKNIIFPYNCDVFIYAGKDQFIDDFFFTILRNRYEFVSLVLREDFEIKNAPRFFDHVRVRAKGHYGFLQRYLQQLYYIEKCNELKKTYEYNNNFKYDLVIRSRLDLGFNKELKLDKIRYDCINLGKRNYTNNYDDCFAIGPSNLMDIYSNRFSKFMMIDFVPKGKLDGSEKQLKYYLSEEGVPVNFLDWHPQELKCLVNYAYKKTWE